MKKLFLTSCFLSLVFVSCENELVETADAGGFSVSEAKNFYNKNAQRIYDDKGKSIDWENGIFHEFNGEKILEFPLDEKTSKVMVQVTARTSRQDVNTILDNVITRVVFVKKGTNIILRELHYVPDLNFLESKNFDISGEYFGKINGDFKGLIVTEDQNDKFLRLTKIKDAKVIAVWMRNPNVERLKLSKNNKILVYAKGDGEPGMFGGPLETVVISNPGNSGNAGSDTDWSDVTSEPDNGSNYWGDSPDGMGNSPWHNGNAYDNGNSSGGGSPTPEQTEDCEALTAYVMSLGGTPTSDLISSETTFEDAETKGKRYTWKFFQGPLFGLYSVETGVQVKVPNVAQNLQWKWQSFTHTTDYKVGTTFGISAEYTINTATPTVGLYNAVMTLNYNVKYSAICDGLGITDESNYNSSQLFNVNN